MNDLMAWLAAGKLQPHVSHRFKLEELPLAFAALLQVCVFVFLFKSEVDRGQQSCVVIAPIYNFLSHSSVCFMIDAQS